MVLFRLVLTGPWCPSRSMQVSHACSSEGPYVDFPESLARTSLLQTVSILTIEPLVNSSFLNFCLWEHIPWTLLMSLCPQKIPDWTSNRWLESSNCPRHPFSNTLLHQTAVGRAVCPWLPCYHGGFNHLLLSAEKQAPISMVTRPPVLSSPKNNL